MPKQISYELPNPAYEAYTWILQDEHGPGAQPPIDWDAGIFMVQPTPPGEVPARVIVNSFTYARLEVAGGNPFGTAPTPHSVDDLTIWRNVWPPQIDVFVREMESFDPASVAAGTWATTLASQGREVERIFTGVHRGTVVSGYIAVEAFTKAYVERFGEESRPETLALLQGFPNLSLERAACLWDLSRIARREPVILAALQAGAPLPDSKAGRDFDYLLREAIARFGHTTNIGGPHLSTWREEPSIPLETVKAYARLPDERGPRATAAVQRQTRRRLEEKVASAADAELTSLLALAQQYLPNLEDHNLICDQRLGAAMRARWLAIGQHLLARGSGAVDDVFYYRRPALIATLEGGPLLASDIIAERRGLMAAVTRQPPPPFLGKPPETKATALRGEAAGERLIRGVAASPGVYTGRARIIETLDDAWRLEEGDVLVSRMTSPPWTLLFAMIGALVVNTGGALSHGAVVAREFGIPAVVGTTYGTRHIPEGATVTVDGTNGVVIVEG